MMTSFNFAEQLKHGESKAVSIVGRVAKIDAYISDYLDTRICKETMPCLAEKPFLISYDLTVIIKDEGRLKFRLSNLCTHIEKGILKENMTIRIKQISKFMRLDFFFLVIDIIETIDNEPDNSFVNSNWIIIDHYRSNKTNLPLGGMIGSYFLDMTSLSDVLYLNKTNLKSLNRLNQVVSNLKSLDDNWTNIKQAPAIVVRVLAISKVSAF